MDWFILLFLIPLILVPVVFLCGFAGCGIDLKGTLVINPPTDLVATVSAGQIVLTWKDTNGGTFNYSIERAEVGQTLAPIGQVVNGTTFTQLTNVLAEGKTYVFRVFPTNTASGSFPGYPSNVATATVFPAKPGNLVATVISDVSVDPSIPNPPPRVELRWTNNSARADGFILKHRIGGSGPSLDLPQSIVPTPAPSQSTFNHHAVTPGTTYEYQVIAYVDGFDTHGNPQQVRSEPSATATATTPAIAPVWKTILQVALNQNPGSNPNDCVVQRLKGPFPSGGSKVRLTLRGPATGSIVIQRIYISQPAAVGNEYDSANDLTKMLDLPPLTIAANAPQLVGPTDYALDPGKDLIVAFDLASPAVGRRGDRPGSAYFIHSNIDEAAKAVRTATGYTKSADLVYLIEKIEVLAPGP